MAFRAVTYFLVCLVHAGTVITQAQGIEQFWIDDQKIYDQIYGRTSDRDLYRTLNFPINNFPNIGHTSSRKFQLEDAIEKKGRIHLEDDSTPSASGDKDIYRTIHLPINNYAHMGIDTRKFQLEDALERKERGHLEDDSTPSASQQDNYLGHYNALLQQQALKTIRNDIAEPTKPTFKFVGYNEFRPISQNNNPEAYNYYKQLELLTKAQTIGFPQEQTGGFKPAPAYVALQNPEETDAYKSIQDILDAHEASKERKRPKTEDKGKHRTQQGRSIKKPPVRYVKSNDISKPIRCVSGRCRTRTYLVRRPVITRIKHRIISDD